MADENGIFSQSGLNEAEAKEVNGFVTQYFLIFLTFAIVAHLLMWIYKPWFTSSEMTTSALETLAPVADALRTFVA